MSALDLDSIVLDHGKHATPDDGMCVMEAAALYASDRMCTVGRQ
jgi:hypothetical protein